MHKYLILLLSLPVASLFYLLTLYSETRNLLPFKHLTSSSLFKAIEICICHVTTPARGVEFLYRPVCFFIRTIENTPKPFHVVGIFMFTVHGC